MLALSHEDLKGTLADLGPALPSALDDTVSLFSRDDSSDPSVQAVRESATKGLEGSLISYDHPHDKRAGYNALARGGITGKKPIQQPFRRRLQYASS